MIDLVVQGKSIVTMDAQRRVLEDGFVAVDQGRIVALGGAGQQAPQAREVVALPDSLVMPGMIDAHFHTTQYFLRGKTQFLANAGRLRLPVWRKFFVPFEYSLSYDEAYWSAIGAYRNLIRVGTTCFADAGGVQPDAMAKALEESGLRGILAISTLDQGTGLPENAVFTTRQALDANADLVERYGGTAGGRIGASLALRQITICSDELIAEMAKLAEALNTRVHIHLSEGAFEIDYCLERAGLRPVHYLEKLGFLGPRVHAAHAAMLTEDEVETLRAYNVSCAHCPSSNFTLFEKPRVPQMRRCGIRMGLGSDGASHGSVDLLKEAKISYVAQISHFGAAYYDRHVVSDYDMVAMVTCEGAQALGLDREIGSLEVGKRADLLMYSLRNANAFPSYDPYYTIARCLAGSDVDTTIVDGKILLRNGRYTQLDDDAVFPKLQATERALAERIIPKSWA